MSDSLSPGVDTFEKDLTFNINNIVANATGYVGMFRWGPIEEVVKITTNESELVQKFGTPDEATTLYFHSALNYLLYTNPLYTVRVAGPGALNAVPDTQVPLLVKNDEGYENAVTTGMSFIARYAGEMGNSLRVEACNEVAFDTWQYADRFEYAPATGEFNLVVVDEDGFISGSANTVLEVYELLTITPGDKKSDGTSAYVGTVLQDQSQWVLLGDAAAIDFNVFESEGIHGASLSGGVDDNDVTTANFDLGWNIFKNQESIDIIRVFTSGTPPTSVGNVIDVMIGRQDAIAFNAPELSDVYNNETAETDVIEYFNTTVNKNTSYAFNVNNWKMVYDKYRDKSIWIPVDSDAAALHARTMAQTEAWFSPAGFNRGQLKNVVKLAWSADKSIRNGLYRHSINSVVSFPGEGVVLFGDKTALRRPSTFNRINVRTLFIVLKKNIGQAAKYQLFELNDYITRGVFRNAVSQYLDNVQARRGLYDYRVVCDESNNTPAVIDANEFVGDIYLKPTRSINYIKLNFVALATGVDFEEVSGS